MVVQQLEEVVMVSVQLISEDFGHLAAHLLVTLLSSGIEVACSRMARLYFWGGDQSHSIMRHKPMGERSQCTGEQTAITK